MAKNGIFLILIAALAACATPNIDFSDKDKWDSPLDDIEPISISLTDKALKFQDTYWDVNYERDIEVETGGLLKKVFSGDGDGTVADVLSSKVNIIDDECAPPIDKCDASYEISIVLTSQNGTNLISSSGSGVEFGINNSVKHAIQNAIKDAYIKAKFYISK